MGPLHGSLNNPQHNYHIIWLQLDAQLYVWKNKILPCALTKSQVYHPRHEGSDSPHTPLSGYLIVCPLSHRPKDYWCSIHVIGLTESVLIADSSHMAHFLIAYREIGIEAHRNL